MIRLPCLKKNELDFGVMLLETKLIKLPDLQRYSCGKIINRKRELMALIQIFSEFFQVNSKCESLLLHPVVTGLLNYKWKRYGRYVYYSNLLLFVTYLVVLNVYMLLIPPFYQIDWVKMVNFRRYLIQGGDETGKVFLELPCILHIQRATGPQHSFRKKLRYVSIKYCTV